MFILFIILCTALDWPLDIDTGNCETCSYNCASDTCSTNRLDWATPVQTVCNDECFSHGVCGEKENWYSPRWMKQKRCSTCGCETTEYVESMVTIQLILLAGVSLSVFASGFLFPCKRGIWYRALFGKLRCCLIFIDRMWYIGVMVANALAFFMWAYVFLAPDYTCCFKIIDSEDADFCIRDVNHGDMVAINYSNKQCVLPTLIPDVCDLESTHTCSLSVSDEPRNALHAAWAVPFMMYAFFFNVHNLFLPLLELVFRLLLCGNKSCCSNHPSARPLDSNRAYGQIRFVSTFYNNTYFSNAFWMITWIFFEAITISDGFLDISYSAGNIQPEADSWYEFGWVAVYQSTKDDFKKLLSSYGALVICLLVIEIFLNITDTQRVGHRLTKTLQNHFGSMLLLSVMVVMTTEALWIDGFPNLSECISDDFSTLAYANMFIVIYAVFFGRYFCKNASSSAFLFLNACINFAVVVSLFVINCILLDKLTGALGGQSKMHCQYLLYNIGYLYMLGFMTFSSGTILCMYVSRLCHSFYMKYFGVEWELARIEEKYRRQLIQLELDRTDILRKRLNYIEPVVDIIKEYMNDLEKTVPPLRDYLVVERIFAGISQQDLVPDIELKPIRPDSGNVIELGRGGEATHGRFSHDYSLDMEIAQPSAPEYRNPKVLPPRYDVASASSTGLYNSENWGAPPKYQADFEDFDQPPGYDDYMAGVSNLNSEEGKSDWNRF